MKLKNTVIYGLIKAFGYVLIIFATIIQINQVKLLDLDLTLIIELDLEPKPILETKGKFTFLFSPGTPDGENSSFINFSGSLTGVGMNLISQPYPTQFYP